MTRRAETRRANLRRAGGWLLCAVLAVGIGGAETALAQAPGDFRPVTDAVLQNPDPGDWLHWRRTLDAHGHSPLDEITPENAGELRLVWSWALAAGSQQTTPMVYDGVMYIANPGERVQALDGETGELLWEYQRVRQPREDGTRPANRQHRNLAIYQDKIYLNTSDAHIVALDARTGEEVWDADIGGGVGYRYTSGSIIADGKVFSGLTGCDRYRDDTCYIIGLDAATGRELWRTSTVARPGERGGDSWGDLPVMFRAGSDAWIPGSYDAGHGTVYFGTAQAKPWARSVRGTDGDALYTNSTLALDPATGELKWYFQHLPGESHDMDETFERILVDYDGRQSVFTMGKIAVLWELDRGNGEFRAAHDLGYQTLFDIHPETGRATYREGMVQEIGEEIHWCPSTAGFKSWRAMSYNPDTEAFYIPLNLNCETGIFGPVEKVEGGGGAGPVRRTNHFHPHSPGAHRRVPGHEHAGRQGAVAPPHAHADEHRRAHHQRRHRRGRRLGPPPLRVRRPQRRRAVADAAAHLGAGLPDQLRGGRQAVPGGAGRHRRRELEQPRAVRPDPREAPPAHGQQRLRLRATGVTGGVATDNLGLSTKTGPAGPSSFRSSQQPAPDLYGFLREPEAAVR